MVDGTKPKRNIAAQTELMSDPLYDRRGFRRLSVSVFYDGLGKMGNFTAADSAGGNRHCHQR